MGEVNSMIRKKLNPIIILSNILIFIVVLFFQTSEIFDISIKTATPMIPLSLIIGFAFFSSMRSAIIWGLISGIMIDSVAYKSYCFNAIAFMLIAVAVYLASNNLFNKNLKAALVLALICSVVYFVLLWILFYSKTSIDSSLGYLLKYALPSATYTAVLVIPFYFIYRYFSKKIIKN